MIARWETATRWYEAVIVCDLFGMWTVLRSWGGKGSRRHGSMIDLVESPDAGSAFIDVLDKQRKQRNPPYVRIR